MRLRKWICAVLIFVLAMYCVNVWMVAPFLENKFERLIPEDYDRYVTAAYPEFDTSLYDRTYFSAERIGGGLVSVMYLSPQILDMKASDPNAWMLLDGEAAAWKIFHYNLLTDRVENIQ